MSSLTETQLAAVAQRVLLEVVRRALEDNRAQLMSWHVRPVGYVKLNPASEGLYRVSGTASTSDGERGWSVILKVMRLPEAGAREHGEPVPPGWGADPRHPEYWKREALAYGSGLLRYLPGEMVAPCCYGVTEGGVGDMPPANVIWLWLEDVAGMPGTDWPLARYELAARHLGQLNGAYLAGIRPLPSAPWLNTTWRRAWAEEAGLHRLDWDRLRDPATWAHLPDLERRWHVPLDQLLARWGAVPIFLLDRADEVM